MKYESGCISLTKFSLYNILFFWIALLVVMYVAYPSFYNNDVKLDGAGNFFSSKINSSSENVSDAMLIYEDISYNLAKVFSYVTEFPKAFFTDEGTNNILLNIYSLSIPYLLTFLLFIVLLDSLSPERLLIGSIVASSILSFTIFLTVSSNNIADDPSMSVHISQIISYAFINMMAFIILYFTIVKIFEKDDNPNS